MFKDSPDIFSLSSFLSSGKGHFPPVAFSRFRGCFRLRLRYGGNHRRKSPKTGEKGHLEAMGLCIGVPSGNSAALAGTTIETPREVNKRATGASALTPLRNVSRETFWLCQPSMLLFRDVREACGGVPMARVPGASLPEKQHSGLTEQIFSRQRSSTVRIEEFCACLFLGLPSPNVSRETFCRRAKFSCDAIRGAFRRLPSPVTHSV